MALLPFYTFLKGCLLKCSANLVMNAGRSRVSLAFYITFILTYDSLLDIFISDEIKKLFEGFVSHLRSCRSRADDEFLHE